MNKTKILIVDDDHQISAGTSVRLRAAGYETVIAHDGVEGLANAHHHRPDAIVLDVKMPFMDGLECLSRLKQDPNTMNIPVVMLSASVVDEEAALDAGARYFLRKPFVGKLLLEAIDAATNEVSELTKSHADS